MGQNILLAWAVQEQNLWLLSDRELIYLEGGAAPELLC